MPKNKKQKPLRKKDIYAIAQGWRDRLDIGRWDLRVDLSIPAGKDKRNGPNWADCSRPQLYHYITIRLRKDWRKWDRRWANIVIVHELLHMALTDLYRARGNHKQFRVAEEEFVHRTAVALVDGWGEL